MKILTSKTCSVEYLSGDTLDSLLAKIKECIEPQAANLEVTSFELISAYEDYSEDKSAVIRVYYKREETPVEIKRREVAEASKLEYDRQQYEALKKKFG